MLNPNGEPMLIRQGMSKTGKFWWIASNQLFELDKCPDCGFPYGIKLTNPSPEIKKVRFVFDEGDRSVTFDITALPKLPKKCNLCGWEQENLEEDKQCPEKS